MLNRHAYFTVTSLNISLFSQPILLFINVRTSERVSSSSPLLTISFIEMGASRQQMKLNPPMHAASWLPPAHLLPAFSILIICTILLLALQATKSALVVFRCAYLLSYVFTNYTKSPGQLNLVSSGAQRFLLLKLKCYLFPTLSFPPLVSAQGKVPFSYTS